MGSSDDNREGLVPVPGAGGVVGVVSAAVVGVDKVMGADGARLIFLRSLVLVLRTPRLNRRTPAVVLAPKGCGLIRVKVFFQLRSPLGCLRVNSFCWDTRKRKSDLSMVVGKCGAGSLGKPHTTEDCLKGRNPVALFV